MPDSVLTNAISGHRTFVGTSVGRSSGMLLVRGFQEPQIGPVYILKGPKVDTIYTLGGPGLV